MTEKKYPVHYANFICHFGNAELLDYLQEIVLPAFKSLGSRKFKDVKYFFHSVQVLDLGEVSGPPEMAICGTFVKDMVVRSEQRYDATTKSLVTDNQKMETAPSATFVLILASHKLIYLSETGKAPGLTSFRSTVYNFLGAARLRYIKDVYDRTKTDSLSVEELKRFTKIGEKGELTGLNKTALSLAIPQAELEIVALSSDESLRAFVQRFKTLQSATLRLVKPNSELDSDEFFAALRDKGNDVGSATSTLTYRNSEGLIKPAVVAQLEAAALEGNTEITLDGVDLTGQKLRGSNDEFKVVSYLESKVSMLPQKARAMLRLFKVQLSTGLISLPQNQLSALGKRRLDLLADQVAKAGDGRP
jgi:hypothetical protein